MLIPYPYVPALHDLWLYEPQTVTWDGGASSADILTPVAWNPDSLLYGYRRSLGGLMLTRRTYSSNGTSLAAAGHLAANDSGNPVNLPAYRNSYPPPIFVIHPRIAWCCHHAIVANASDTRNPSGSFADLHGATTYLRAVFTHRFMRADDSTIQMAATDLGYPFRRDTAWNATPGWYVSAPGGGDIAVIEFSSDFAGEPLTVVDARTMPKDAEIFCIDGSAKIIPDITFRRAGVCRGTAASSDGEGKCVLVDETDSPGLLGYNHDSGASFWTVLREPTSNAAGDGILGLLSSFVFTTGQPSREANTGDPVANIPGCIMTPGRTQTDRVVDYWTDRGYPSYPFHVRAARGSSTLATEAAVQSVIGFAETIKTNLGA